VGTRSVRYPKDDKIMINGCVCRAAGRRGVPRIPNSESNDWTVGSGGGGREVRGPGGQTFADCRSRQWQWRRKKGSTAAVKNLPEARNDKADKRLRGVASLIDLIEIRDSSGSGGGGGGGGGTN
jgi:hypothetical protein